ncbi:DUF1801 domain-containing protein [bacterium]|nr:DUF1801 domain-containing protein [bacterium]
MAELKTKPGAGSVTAFLAGVDPERRKQCRALMKIMKDVTGARPVMWGPGIVGYGRYHYRYESGREGDFFLAGFSPRKRDLTVYVMSGFSRHGALMKKLGPHKTGKSCLYLRSLDDVDLPTLTELLRRSVAYMSKKYR